MSYTKPLLALFNQKKHSVVNVCKIRQLESVTALARICSSFSSNNRSRILAYANLMLIHIPTAQMYVQ